MSNSKGTMAGRSLLIVLAWLALPPGDQQLIACLDQPLL